MQSSPLEVSISGQILRSPFSVVMLPTVNLNHETGRGDVKIHHIPPQRLLPSDRDGKLSQKIIPQMPFLWRDRLSQGTGGNAAHPCRYSSASFRNLGSARWICSVGTQ